MRREVFVHDLFLYAYLSPIVIAAIWIILPLFVFPKVEGVWYFVALGAGIIGPNLAESIAETFLETEFSGAQRHARRIRQIENQD